LFWRARNRPRQVGLPEEIRIGRGLTLAACDRRDFAPILDVSRDSWHNEANNGGHELTPWKQHNAGSAASCGSTPEGMQSPPGPTYEYDPTEDLLLWMSKNFARYGDIYKASVFGRDVYVVSNPEFCEHILRWNWRNYARSGQVVKRISLLLGNGLIASNGEFWASQRRMIQPAFTKSSIGGLTTLIANANAELLEAWKRAARAREMVNVTTDVSRMVLKVTLAAIFGDDYAAVATHFGILAEQSERDLEFAQIFRHMSKVIRDIAVRRRGDSAVAKDFLGSMMQARSRESGVPMSDGQLATEAMTLIVAGHETTASILNWIWCLLSRHPKVQTKLGAELDRMPWQGAPTMEELPRYAYTRRIIDEALRMYPPLWLMTRKALADDRLGRFFVPAGTEVYISPYLIQHSPTLWEVPENFDPDRMGRGRASDRHELALCPFGAGPRNCIGEFLARAEIQIHLMMIARELRFRSDHAKPPEVTTGINLLSKHDFIMQPEFRGDAAG
jgi:enediyne biosynthesis protein E7